MSFSRSTFGIFELSPITATITMEEREDNKDELMDDQEVVERRDTSGDDEEMFSEDEDEAQEQLIRQYAKAVDDNLYNYDAHIQLITVLRKSGDLEQLRKAREKMNEVFPLSPELWLDWLKDEAKLSSCDESRKSVIQLFKRAVKDYTSVEVWLEYCQFSIGELAESEGVKNIRDVFEQALTAVGLHMISGNLIWEAYREFENAVLSMHQPVAGGVADAETKKVVDEQIKRIASIFKRQLYIPHQSIEQTYEEYKEWKIEELDDIDQTKYEIALKNANDRLPLEEKLECSAKPHLQEYLDYLQYEEEQGDPARIQCLYERAITDNCLVPHLWTQYCNYIDKKLKIGGISLPLHERSVRNCPWSANLWIDYIQAAERFQQPCEMIKSLVDRSLVSGFSQAEEYLQIWMMYLEHLNRQVNWSKTSDNDQLKLLRDTFQQAIDYMSQYFPHDGDPYCTIQQYWARLEARHLKNMNKAREIWESIMKHGNRKYAHMSIEYYNLERSYGDIEHERKVLQMGVQCASDNPESIVNILLTLEKDAGTLEQYNAAVVRCEAQMGRVQERRAKAAEKETEKKQVITEQRKAKMLKKKGSAADHKVVSDKDKSPKKGLNKADEAQVAKPTSVSGGETSGKRPPPPGFYKQKNTQPAFKRPKTDKPSTENAPTVRTKEDEEKTVFLSNLSYTLDEDVLKDVFLSVGTITDLRIVKDYKGSSKGYGYLEFKTSSEAKEALKMDRHLIDNRPMYVSACNSDRSKGDQPKFKFETGLEKNKLFVRGLSFDTTKDDLEEYFKQFGEIKEVRLVTYRSGNSKGLAFIEYNEESSAKTAVLKADGINFQGRDISVAISNPPERKGKSNLGGTLQQSLGSSQKFGSRGRGRTNLEMVPRALAATKATAKAKNGTENGAEVSKPKMSNADFRNMLLKK